MTLAYSRPSTLDYCKINKVDNILYLRVTNEYSAFKYKYHGYIYVNIIPQIKQIFFKKCDFSIHESAHTYTSLKRELFISYENISMLHFGAISWKSYMMAMIIFAIKNHI